METAAPTQAAPPADVIGRFRIVRILGRGAQGAVYLASDPELGRLVAIKRLPVSGEGSQDRFDRLLREARTASGLSHPNVVPVYEVGLALDAPYVVFEYVEGRTLAQLIKSDGALSTAKAVIAMSQILAGIAHAHTKGLVHGDIKPANILLAQTGVPRITDFGIARGLLDFNAESSAGTVRYMAPEHFNGGHADQRADVFALGLVFWEMLTGEPVNTSGDNTSTIYRILNEAIPKPSDKKPGVDPRLDEIVMRALDKNPDARFRDAGEMKAVLDRVRVGANGETTTQIAAGPAPHSTVEFLLRRMRHKSNFPALSQRFSAINQLTSDDSDGSVQKLANLVMQDFALTHKLLQIVNSAAHGGGGNVTSVSQAIVKLGMQQVRAVASSLMLATPPQAANVHPGLHEVLLGSFVAAVVGRNIGRMAGLQNVEEAFVCSMFGRLGEILSIYYLGEDYDEVIRVVRTQGVAEMAASRSVLGIGFDELGIEVARQWNFPPDVLHAMRSLPEGPLAPAQSERERIAHAAGFARELCDAAWRTRPEERSQGLLILAERFRASIPKTSTHLAPLIEHSLDLGLKYCAILGVNTQGSALIEGLRAWTRPPEPAPMDALAEATAVAANDSVSAPAPIAQTAPRTGSGVSSWFRKLIGKSV